MAARARGKTVLWAAVLLVFGLGLPTWVWAEQGIRPNKHAGARRVINRIVVRPAILPGVDWEPYERLTSAPGHSWISSGGERCLAVSGDTLHAVWYDERTGNDEVYYKRSTDGGTTWGPDVQLTLDSAYQAMPTVAVSGPVVHVFWTDERNKPGRIREADIYYRRSTDGGETWQPETLLCTNPAGEYGGWHPCAACRGDTVHLVWEDDRNGDDLIHYKRSTDRGQTWTQDRAIASDMGAWLSTIAVWGKNVHVVWENFNSLRVWYRRSTDGGNTWQPQVSFPTETVSYAPCVDVSHDTVHVVYSDGSQTNFDQLYYRRSIDNGVTWEPETCLTQDSDFTWSADVAVSGKNVHVVRLLMDFYHIWYHRSTDGGVTWEPGVEVSDYFRMQCMDHAVAVSDTTVHVLFDGMIPESTGFYEIYYRRNRGGNPVAMRSRSDLIPVAELGIHIVPNPVTSDQAMLRLAGQWVERNGGTIRVFDAAGRCVLVRNIPRTLLEGGGNRRSEDWSLGVTLDLRRLSAGVYLVRFETKDAIATGRIAVVRSLKKT